jgi:ERCC4-type nuclease
VLVVEGALGGWFSLLPSRRPLRAHRLEAAVIEATVRDCVHVIRTKNSEATAEALWLLYTQMQEGKLDGAAHAQAAVAAGYASFICPRKASNGADAADTWRAMLVAVRGVSSATAQAVARAFPRPADMVRRLEGLTAAEGAAALSKVEVSERRTLGPKVGARLAELFSS